MIPLGVLANSRHVQAGGGAEPPVASWIGAADSGEDLTAYTIDLPAGDAGGGVIIAVAARKAAPSATVTSITANGAPAAILGEFTENGSTATIAFAATNPAAPLAVTVTYSETVLRCAAGAWSCSAAAVEVQGVDGSANSVTVDTFDGASVISVAASTGYAAAVIDGPDTRWSNVVAGERSYAAFADALGDGSPSTYSVTWRPAMLAVALAPTT